MAFLESTIVNVIDYKGRRYRAPDFHARRDASTGPGWYVFGRSFDEYAPSGIIMLCARPDVKPRRHPHYNCLVRRGWRTLREAKAISDRMNAGETVSRPTWCQP